MVAKGDAWAVVSQDYDCLQFGASRMLKNFKLSSRQSKDLQVISLEKTLNELNVTREQLVDIAILVGTDFNAGIHGIGPKKGLKLIQKYGNLESALKKLDKTIEEDYNQIREIFLKPDVVTDYDLKFRNPKREKLVDFLCGDHDFTEERTFAAIDKLVHETAQTSLEQWF
jgi:flap endonuclease-1